MIWRSAINRLSRSVRPVLRSLRQCRESNSNHMREVRTCFAASSGCSIAIAYKLSVGYDLRPGAVWQPSEIAGVSSNVF